jgi:hypothetical protein
MKIGGISIVLLLGILNFVLILFQISSGFRLIKVPFEVHKRTGIALFVSATTHAVLAYLTS